MSDHQCDPYRCDRDVQALRAHAAEREATSLRARDGRLRWWERGGWLLVAVGACALPLLVLRDVLKTTKAEHAALVECRAGKCPPPPPAPTCREQVRLRDSYKAMECDPGQTLTVTDTAMICSCPR